MLLAALPAHVLVEVQAGFPPLLIALLFLTNCLEALLAAAAVHLWSDDPTRFDSLPRVLVFVAGAVLMAPVVSSFADAGVVHVVRGEAYGLVFVRRTFSNMLSQLTLVPSAVLLVRHGHAWLHTATQRRGAEAVLLAVARVAGWSSTATTTARCSCSGVPSSPCPSCCPCSSCPTPCASDPLAPASRC